MFMLINLLAFVVHILGVLSNCLSGPLKDGSNFLFGIGLVIPRLYFLDGFAILSYQMAPAPSGVRCVPTGNR